jgi:Protein of unknown function (DUF1593)/Phage integrase family
MSHEIQGEISPRIKCSSLRFKCNSLLHLNRGLPGDRSLRFKYSATTGLEKEPESPLFPASIGRTGKLSRRPLVRTDAADMLKPLFKQAGLPAHYSPHSFRATGITNFLENDGTLEAAQRIAAGHADSRTTKLYDRRGQKVLLEDMERTRSNYEFPPMCSTFPTPHSGTSFRVYSISDQDESGPWMRQEFPDLFYIVTPSNSFGTPLSQEDFIPATWGGINTLATSGQGFNEASGVDNTKVLEPWLDANIRSKGPLGAAYPPIQFLMEGDMPSWFSLVNNGLDSYRNPSWGGWGVDTNGEYFTESHGPFGPKGLPA